MAVGAIRNRRKYDQRKQQRVDDENAVAACQVTRRDPCCDQEPGGDPAVSPCHRGNKQYKHHDEHSIRNEVAVQMIELEPAGVERRQWSAGENDVASEAPVVREGFAEHGDPGRIEPILGQAKIERRKYEVDRRAIREKNQNSKDEQESPRLRSWVFGCAGFHKALSDFDMKSGARFGVWNRVSRQIRNAGRYDGPKDGMAAAMLSRLPWHWRGTMRSLPMDPRLRNTGCNAGPGTGQLAHESATAGSH
jgi:hypothetical protein